MTSLRLHLEFDQSWTNYRRTHVGPIGRRVEYYIPVALPGLPPLLVEVGQDPGEYSVEAFDCAVVWAGWVIIGIGQRVHFVSVTTQAVASHVLGEGGAFDYVGHLYPYPAFVLVASGQHLARFDQAARQVWQTERLAVDGVLVERVEGSAIYGQGEQDPPGGWRSFVVALESGAKIG